MKASMLHHVRVCLVMEPYMQSRLHASYLGQLAGPRAWTMHVALSSSSTDGSMLALAGVTHVAAASQLMTSIAVRFLH